MALLLFFFTLCSLRSSLFHHRFASGEALPDQQTINVWPKPRFLEWSSPQRSLLLSRSFTIISPPTHPHLSAAVRRYLHLILSERYHPPVAVLSSFPTTTTDSQSTPLLHRLVVVISGDLHAPLQHGVDESYNLTIPPPYSETATLRAETVWGAMRGLETFSQLVHGDPPRAAPGGVEVRDWPMFGHRGVLLDTSRNFYSVEDILRTIAAMSANKLNLFHWHISDSQSFPLVLPSEPRLAAEGSYGAEMQYTPEDVGRIVRFGMEHGVRVMPEIDAPGHTGSWAGAYPEIVSCAGKFWWPAGSEWAERMASEPGSGQLNPLNQETYRVYANIINDVSSLFPEHLFHAGGDEVVPGCWKSDPAIQSYLASKKGATLSDLLEKFVNSTLPLIINSKDNNRTTTSSTAVYWEDVLLDNNVRVRDSALLPPERTIMQSWNGGPDNTLRLVKLGYRTIVSSSDYYYLDCGHGGFVGNDSGYDRAGDHGGNGGSWCSPFKTWQRIYDYDVVPADVTSEDERSLVIGGEVALWSEQSDGTVLDSRLWPRASAFAESMWSGNRDEKTGQKRYAEATQRLGLWRHRMVVGRRAVAAEPIQPLWCLRNPGMCNTQNSS